MKKKILSVMALAVCSTCLVCAHVVKVYRSGRVVAAYKVEKVDSITVDTTTSANSTAKALLK